MSFLACLLLFVTCIRAHSEWVISNEALSRRNITHVYAIGSIHGALYELLAVGRAIQICDEEGNWSNRRNVIVVQTGDLIHKGPASVAVARTLKEWQRDAVQSSSQVIVLRGNHEEMQIMRSHSHYRNLTEDYATKNGSTDTRTALSSGMAHNDFYWFIADV